MFYGCGFLFYINSSDKLEVFKFEDELYLKYIFQQENLTNKELKQDRKTPLTSWKVSESDCSKAQSDLRRRKHAEQGAVCQSTGTTETFWLSNN